MERSGIEGSVLTIMKREEEQVERPFHLAGGGGVLFVTKNEPKSFGGGEKRLARRSGF